MASVSTILGFVVAGSANVNGYTVLPAGQSGADNVFVKYENGPIVEYYCFSDAALKVIALDDTVAPSDNTNISKYAQDGSGSAKRYSKDAKAVLQYEDIANIAHYIFYIDLSVSDTSIQTFTTNSDRYSSASSFNLTVVNIDGSKDVYTKTANTNIIKPQGSSISVVYDDLGFLQAATDKYVDTAGIVHDVVAAGEIVKYIKSASVTEYYKKGAAANGTSVPLFKQVNADGSDIAGPITWREYGTNPDSLTTYAFATDASYPNGNILVSGGYVILGQTTAESVRTFTREASGVITEVSDVKHWFAYTNDGYASAIDMAAAGNKINDIRGSQAKPVASSGLVYDVKFHAVHYKDGIYRAFTGYSDADINPELFANGSQYLANELLCVMKARSQSDNLSKIDSAVKKVAESLINVLVIELNTPKHTVNYIAYKNIGLKNAAADMADSEQVTKDGEVYTRDAANVLRIASVYISYGAVSKHEFASNTYYTVDKVLKQRTVDPADDVVMSKWAVDSVNADGLDYTETYSEAGIRATVHREGDAVRSTIKVLSESDDSILRTLNREATDLPSEQVGGVKHYYAITNATYEIAINNASVGNVINDIRGGQDTADNSVDQYEVKFSKVTYLSGVYRAFAGYTVSDINPELFANDSQYVKDDLLCVMNARSASDNLSKIASAVKKVAESLINVQVINSNVPIDTSNYNAYKNIGLKNAAADMADSEQVTKDGEVYTRDAANVLRIASVYISYGAVSKHEFATNTYYAVDKVLKQRTVDPADDVVISKWAVDSVNADGLDYTETYSEAGIRATVHREGDAVRSTLKVLSESDDSILRTLNREATDLPSEQVDGVKHYYAITNSSYEIAINNAAVGNMINDIRGGQNTADTSVDKYLVKFNKVTYLSGVYRAFAGYSVADINPELLANDSQYVKDDLLCVMKTRDQSDSLSKIASAVKKVAESLINVQVINSNVPMNTSNYNAYKNIGLKNAAADMANSEQVTKDGEVYTRDALNVLKLDTTYISYMDAVSKYTFATTIKYVVDDLLRQRTVDESDANIDVVMSKWAVDSVNAEGVSHTETYTEAGIRASVHREGDAVRSTIKVLSESDDSILRTLNREATDLPSEQVGGVKHYYAITNATYEIAINNASVGNVINDIRGGQDTADNSVDQYEVKFSKVTYLSGVYRAFAGYSDADINPELFANGSQYLANELLCVMKARSQSDNLSKIDSAVKKVAESLINVLVIELNTPKHTVNYIAYKNIGLKNAAADMADSEQVTKDGEVYTRDAANVLRIASVYISYGAVSKHEFATNTYYAVDKVLKQRTVDESDANIDVVMSKWAVDSVNADAVDYTETYSEAGIRASVHREGDAVRSTLKVLSESDDSILRTLNREATDLPSEQVDGVKHYYAITNATYEIAINNASVGNVINDIRGGEDTANTSVDQYEVKFSKVTYLSGVYRAFAGYSVSDINPELLANDSQYVKDDLLCVMKARSQSDNLSKIASAVKKVNESLINVQEIVANVPQHTSQYNAYRNIGLKNAAADMADGEQVTKDGEVYTRDAANVLRIASVYISYLGAIDNYLFATGKYLKGDVLRKRFNDDTDINIDIVVNKIEVDAVDEDGQGYTEAYSANGLKGAIQLESGRDVIIDIINSIEYTRVQRNVLKNASTYYEYNGLETITLRDFSTAEYTDKDYIIAMDKDNGATGKTYQKVLASVILDFAAGLYYEFNSLDSRPVRESAQAALTDVPKDAVIVDMLDTENNEPAADTARYVKYKLNLVRLQNGYDWYAYSLLAMGNISNIDDFAEKHTLYYLVTGEQYDYVEKKVFKMTGSSTYLMFDNVVSEEQYATQSKYDDVGRMLCRASNASNDTSDIVIDKWAANVVNTSADQKATHVYGNLGMRNVANMTDNIWPVGDNSTKKVREMSESISYTYIKQYLLKKDDVDELFEYNDLATLTLQEFTTNSNYVGILHKREVTYGTKVSDYNKVMSGVSKIDTTVTEANTYYVFSKAAREAAVDENNTIVPSSPSSIIYQNINGTVTTFYKTAISTAENLNGPPDFEVGTYYALGQLAIGASDATFTDAKTVLFTDIDTKYVRVSSKVIREVGTQNYIVYDGEITQEEFATGSYVTGATLILRSSSQTDPDTNVTDSDVLLLKIGDNIVNKAVNSLAPVWEDNTYAYGPIGMKNASAIDDSKTHVIDVNNSNNSYTKFKQYLLGFGGDLFEYNSLGAYSIKQFVSGSTDEATYSFALNSVLHKMNTTTGAELATFKYVELNVALAVEDSEYYGYETYVYRAVSQDDNISEGAKLIITSEPNKPSSNDYSLTLYTKSKKALMQHGINSGEYIAVTLDGLKSAVTVVMVRGDNVTVEVGSEDSWGYLKADTKWYYEAANLVSTDATDKGTSIHKHYLTYTDVDASLSEETFATDNSYENSTASYGGDMLVRRGASSDAVFTKLFVNAILPDGQIIHAYGDLGMLKCATNSVKAFPFNLVEIYGSKEYVAEVANVLREVATGDYFEYNALATITLEEFTNNTTASDRDYSIGRKLYKRSIADGSAVHVYTKVMTYLSQIDTPDNYFYAYSIDARRDAINDDGQIVPISSTVEQTLPDKTTIYVKTSVGSASADSAFEVTSYIALAQLVTENAGFVNGSAVYFVTENKTYIKDAANVIVEQGTENYITFDQALSRKEFAINNKYAISATLAQRSASATSPADDVIYTKIDNNCVDSNKDSNSSIAYTDLGLLGAARSSTKAEVKLVTADNTAITDNSPYVYTILDKNLLKLTNANEYLEYNELATVSLRQLSSNADRTYAIGSILKKMSSSDGTLQNTFTKTVDNIVLDQGASAYYSYNGFVYAGDQADNIIAVGSKIYDVAGNKEAAVGDIAYIKHHLSLLRKDGASEWHSNSYLALAYASKSDSEFVSGHYVIMHNIDARYNYYAASVVQENSTENYITFDQALSRKEFAINNKYPISATLAQRSASATSPDADVIYTKIDSNCVDCIGDTSSIAYGDLGLLGAARSSTKTGIKLVTADNYDISDISEYLYTILDKNLLKLNSANEYLEYSEFVDTTLKSLAGSSYDNGSTIKKMSSSDGSLVNTFTKTVDNIVLDQGASAYYSYNGFVYAGDQADNIIAVGSKIYDVAGNKEAAVGDIAYIKHHLSLLRKDGASEWYANTYQALAYASKSDEEFVSGHYVIMKNITARYNYYAVGVVKDNANAKSYITFDQALSRKEFAINDVYLVTATLAQRSASATSPDADVIYSKIDNSCVNSNKDDSSIAYADLGLLGAARSSAKASVKLVTADNAVSDESVTLYDILAKNLLQLHGANEYLEYSEFVDTTLRALASSSYANGSTIKKMSKSNGSLVNTFSKTVDNIVLDQGESVYYSYNGFVYAGDQANATIAVSSKIYDVKGNKEAAVGDIAYIKHHLSLLRKDGESEWHANTYVALAYASKSDSEFVSGHYVIMHNIEARYNYKDASVVQDNANMNNYITFDAALTEETYATDDGAKYAVGGQLIQRPSSTEGANDDVTIDKLAVNLVNTSADAKTHAYDNLGLRNAAVSNGSSLKAKIIDIKNSNKEYLYNAQYILQESAANHYYEYNALATLTLKAFTSLSTDGNRSYPVGRKLFGRDSTTGASVVVYEKVITAISKKDGLNDFWVYSIAARDVAINEDGTKIPAAASGLSRSAIHYIDSSDLETVYYKLRVGGVMDQLAQPNDNYTPDQIAESYAALAAFASDTSDNTVGQTVEFKNNGSSSYYYKVDLNIIQNATTKIYIAYNGAVTRKAFATGSYASGAILIQRDASLSVEAVIFAADITLIKLGDSAVNRNVGGGADDAQTYAYADMGLMVAARSSSAKSVVRLVTADDVSGDSSVVNYTKVSANILQLGIKYFEYNNFGSLSISAFAAGAYVAGNELHKMSTSDGHEETESYMTPYIKKMDQVVMDSASNYYVYGGDEAPAAKAAVNIIPIGALMIMNSRSNEPAVNDKQYSKRAVALLQVGSSGAHNAYAQIGLSNAAVFVLSATQTVSYSGITWTYSANNELVTGSAGSAQYLSFMTYIPATYEPDFARNAPYVAGDVLLQRTLSSNTDVNATASDVTITKLAAKVVNISTDSDNTHSYDVDGLAAAAQLADSTAVKSKILDISNSVTYLRVGRYLLKNVAGTEFFEFNALATLSIRSFATGSYSVSNKLHKMDTSSGAELNVFTKKYADIVQDGNSSEYYCYNEPSLSSVANEYIDVIAAGAYIWEMTGNNEASSSVDTKWTKTERFVLQAAHNGSNKKYNIYSIAIGAGIPLNEFACDSAYANGDRLIRKVSPNDVYDRVVQSVLRKNGDVANNFSTYYYGSIVPSHLELKGASLATDAQVPVNSTLVMMDGSIWTKKSTGILNKGTAFIAFVGSLGPETLATNDGTYAIGSTLRLVNDDDALSVNYVKNLSGVIYQYQSDEYECYGANGLKNAAQSANLVENRNAANPYVLRPELNQIELNAPIKHIASGVYYFKYRQNVLVGATKSGSNYSVTVPANFYDYTASAFGTLSLQEFATSATFKVNMQLTDALQSQGTWTKSATDVILQGNNYFSYSDAIDATAGNKWLAYNGVVGNAVVEQSPLGSISYTILENGVLQSDNTYYAYSIANDTDGLSLNTFATSGATYPLVVLVDRTSARAGPRYERTDDGLLLNDAGNYQAFTEAALQTFAAKTLTTSTTVTEDATGTWTMTGRKVYTWNIANVLKISSEAAYYVYNLSSLSLNKFATHPSYAKNDTLVDRSSLYDGPRYRKVLSEHGVLERNANLAASADAALLTYDGNGILGLRTASLAAVADISDSTILVPEVSSLNKHLRCAKGLLRMYADASSLSSSFKVFQIDSNDEPIAALRLAAKNLDAADVALTGDRVVAVESSLYVTAATDVAYNVGTVSYVKDSDVFVDTLRVGTDAVSDKITYANVDGTHYAVLKNMCEQDANGSLAASSSAVAKYLNKKLYDRSVNPAVTYYVLSRGVLRVDGNSSSSVADGIDHVFSDNGLVAEATNSDSVQVFALHSVSGGVEGSSTFKRKAKGLLVSAFIVDGVPATDNEDGAAILYYSDYSASAKDDLKNMNYYLYSLAKQGSVGGITTTNADVITAINIGTITKLYTIVTKIGGSSKAQQFAIVKDSGVIVSNIIRVTDIDGANEYFLAYNESGVTKGVSGAQPLSVVAEALARDGLSNAANSSAVVTGSILYAASSSDNNAKVANFEFKKNGSGSMDGPGPVNGDGAQANKGSVFTYSAEGIRTFAKLNRPNSTSIPKGARGTNATANVYTAWASKTYYSWEQSVVLAMNGAVQNYEVYDGADVQFARRLAMAEANINAIDYADVNNKAYIAGSKLVMCGANVNTSSDVKTYSKIDTGLIKLDNEYTDYYAFSDYGLAAGANLSSLPVDIIEMKLNEDMNLLVDHRVWFVMTAKLLKSGSAWRSYNATGATDAGNKEYFAVSGRLADVMTVYGYAAPNTTTLKRAYTIILDGTTTSLIEVDAPVSGESIYQTYGHEGLALIANDSTLAAFNGSNLKVREVEMIAITGGTNNANPGKYKKLQQGAMYKGSNIMLYDENKFQEVMDRFDITEFTYIDLSNDARIKKLVGGKPLTYLSLNPQYYLTNPVKVNGTVVIGYDYPLTAQLSDGTDPYNIPSSRIATLERDYLPAGANATDRLSNKDGVTKVKPFSVKQQSGSVQNYAVQTYIEYVNKTN